jgi:(S)-3,5-dihydroxyphenylglycine transaminase
MVKSIITVNTPTLSQAVIGGMLLDSDCRLAPANAGKARFYANNLETLLAGLDRHFPLRRRRGLGIDWHVPDGGFFVMLRLPFRADADLLTVSAREYSVIWTPMNDFYIGSGGEHEIRLSCSYLEPLEITEGLARLARFIEDHVR